MDILKTPPQLVIFDMDGTMLDTEPLSMAGWHHAFTAMGYNKPLEEFVPVFKSGIGTNYNAFKVLLANYLGESFDFQKGYDMQLDHIDLHFETHGVPIKPGLLPLLDKLEELNIKKCVATSTKKERATHKLTLANVAHRFEVVVGGDEVVNSKPDPEIFLKAAAACNIAPAHCLAIEDSAAGTESAFRAGMQVINIPDMLPPSDATQKMAWRVCKDLFEVGALFSRF